MLKYFQRLQQRSLLCLLSSIAQIILKYDTYEHHIKIRTIDAIMRTHYNRTDLSDEEADKAIDAWKRRRSRIIELCIYMNCHLTRNLQLACLKAWCRLHILCRNTEFCS